jgi:Zn-dependent protease
VGGLDLTEILILMTVLVASLTVHEAAHAWSATQLGDPTARSLGRLSLNPAVHVDVIGTIVFPLVAIATGVPLIGWAKPVPVDFRYLRAPRRDFAVIAAAGPASNIGMAVAGAAVYSVLGGNDAYWSGSIVFGALRYFILLNVLLAVFNMIPIPPLDGGNVLMGVLPHDAAHAIDRVRPYGFLLLYLLMFSGLLSAIIRPVQRFVLSWLL